jgi:hypothetical protein
MKKQSVGYVLLGTLSLCAIGGILFMDPIEQNTQYHNFSDENYHFNIPNFWNVVSNLPFLLIGLFGLIKIKSITSMPRQYVFFFLGVSFVAFGSAYYHWNPNNQTLVWDRLPMTIAFMSLFSIVISEFINEKKGQQLLFSLIGLGVLSVLYWIYFDDLRIYLLVQFLPMLAIPVILLFFRSKYSLTRGYWWLLLAYILAKVFEHFDTQINLSLGVISGHSLKHLMAACGIGILLTTYLNRKKIE